MWKENFGIFKPGPLHYVWFKRSNIFGIDPGLPVRKSYHSCSVILWGNCSRQSRGEKSVCFCHWEAEVVILSVWIRNGNNSCGHLLMWRSDHKDVMWTRYGTFCRNVNMTCWCECISGLKKCWLPTSYPGDWTVPAIQTGWDRGKKKKCWCIVSKGNPQKAQPFTSWGWDEAKVLMQHYARKELLFTGRVWKAACNFWDFGWVRPGSGRKKKR